MTLQRPTEYLTPEEADRVLRMPRLNTIAGLRDYCILGLMLRLGLRRAEVSHLKVGDLRIEPKHIWLDIFGKRGRHDKLPLRDKNLLKALLDYKEKADHWHGPDAPMFLTLSERGGRPIQAIGPETVRRVVEKYIKEAGITKRITPHSFRHTCLTEAGKLRPSAAALRDFARHKNIRTTSRYLHSTEQELEEIAEKLAH